MKFKCSGTKRVILNSIRRTILQSIPTFGFSQEYIQINALKSDCLDSDIMKHRISMIPVPTLLSEKEFDSFLLNQKSIIKGITMKCCMENTGLSILHVTTKNCIFDQPNPYKNDILICSLQSGEKIDFIATAIVGTSHAIFCPTSKCYLTEEFLYIYPRINYSASKILLDAIKLLKLKLNNIEIKPDKIIFPNDKFTLPILLVDYLQDHESIKYAGAMCNHLLESDGYIHFLCKDDKKIDTIFCEIVQNVLLDLDRLINLFSVSFFFNDK